MANIDYIRLPETVNGEKLANYTERAFEEFAEENGYEVKVEKIYGIEPGPEPVETRRKIELRRPPVDSHIDPSCSLTKLSTEIDVNFQATEHLKFSEVMLGKESMLSVAEKLYKQIE
ncbi:MAG: hypothetical protein ABEK36_02155 [Candidatus Aenigmatarchaeota archaeon]